MANQVISAIKGTARVLLETYKLGFRAWWLAPAIVAIAIVPEFAQHVAEIRLGMFESLQRFSDLAQHPDRWMFGYAKVAGLIVAMLAIARFWAVGSVRKTFAIAPADLLRLVFAIGLTWAVSLPFDWLAARNLPAAVILLVRVVSAVVQAGLTLFVIAALFGDRSLTLRTAFTERLPTALVLAVAVLFAFMPAQMLHMLNHKLAIGQSATVVWVLMIWDALVVGLIASLVGSALWAAYRSGATWRGWGADFMPATTDASAPADIAEAEPVAAPLAPPAPPEPVPAPALEPTEPTPRRRRPRPGPRPRG